jgi:hypothetical protein
MYSRLLASIGFAGLMFASPAFAAAPCCQEMKADKACCDMPCCKDHVATVAMPDSALTDPFFLAIQTEPPVPPVVNVAARQTTAVWFMQPVRVGDKILQGRYVIEHDNDRMARGEPCTHIYAFNDQKTPVVAFHCTHLERDAAKGNTVVLQSNPDGLKTLTEFQFNGETAAHGYPTIR